MDVDRSNGSYRGTIYIVWANASDTVRRLYPDILLVKSTDGGTTWSSPIRVNDDVSSPQTDQFLPWLKVDTYGGVNVAFYDSRIDPTNNLLTRVTLAHSVDGGQTFKNYPISDTAFVTTYVPGTYGYFGDYMGLTTTGDYVIPNWWDPRRGTYQTFIARFPIYPMSSSVAGGWNLVSLPEAVLDSAKVTLWPDAQSSAFGFRNGTYVTKDTVAVGYGYWLKFATNKTVNYAGERRGSVTVNVDAGWNIVGSISYNLSKLKVTPLNTSVISNFFEYSGSSYVPTDTLRPGKGYWVKVSNSGMLKLDTSSSGGGSTNTQNPPPPAPTLLAPSNGATNQPVTLTLSWNPSSGAAWYRLQVSTSSSFGILTLDDSTITATSRQVSGLANSTTYYWRLNAKNAAGTSLWSDVWNFGTTSAPPPDPCGGSYSVYSSMDVLTVTDATSRSQALYVRNGGRAIAPGLSSDDEMPPEPVAGAFNARFQSGKFMEAVPPTQAFVNLPISVKSAPYPLTLRWDVKRNNGTRYWFIAPGGSGRTEMTGTGSMTIASSDNGTLLVQAQATQPCPPAQLTERQSDKGIEKLLPHNFALHQNYPNPFNPTTEIHYDLPEDSHVRLRIYNVLGQEVMRLVDEMQQAGFKSATFDASSLSSGMYFYRLEAGHFTEIKKMILLK
ncbi:MAG: T9SS type A sorting domain-containing protein [Ignavibacteriae bacterium]|nr:T9SS type A sorting domain-containing protein [Ignavibacteria bacterium]MBI3363940.1 T9SS type A sorting domain-containing protein [Ignavibacteriota bacterium]